MAKLYGEIASSALMTFDKSFARANGQPLDSTEVYYSLQSAKEYAAGAGAYIGQKIVVVDSTTNPITITHYSIEDTAGTLKELGVKPVGDNSSIVVAGNGTISLKGIDTLTFERDILDGDGNPTGEKEAVQYQPLMTKTGLIWIEPSKTTVEGLSSLIEALSGRVTALEKVISETTHFKTEVVDSVEKVTKEGILYLIKDTETTGVDVYKEYLFLNNEATLIGDTSTNLSDYYTKEEINEQNNNINQSLNKKVDKDTLPQTVVDIVTGQRAEGSANLGVEAGAQVNLIEQIKLNNKTFTVEGKIAQLTGLAVSDLSGGDSLINRITGAENNITSQGNRITSLEETTGGHTQSIQALSQKQTEYNENFQKVLGDKDTPGSMLNLIAANAPSVATASKEGLVKSVASGIENGVSVASDGTMSVNSINVNKLVQTDGDFLVLNGGTANLSTNE